MPSKQNKKYLKQTILMTYSIQSFIHDTLTIISKQTVYQIFSRNTEVFTLESQGNLEEMLLMYYMDGDTISNFESSMTHTGVIPLAKGLKYFKAIILTTMCVL